MAIALRTYALAAVENWGGAMAYSHRFRDVSHVLMVLAIAISSLATPDPKHRLGAVIRDLWAFSS
jgi:hypothetical protein